MYEEDDYGYDVTDSVVPNEQRHLRACLICGMVRTYNQFVNTGCPNCPFDQQDFAQSCTTPNFSGMVAVMEPTRSWVAKWQRIRMSQNCTGKSHFSENKKPGCYALLVHGRLGGDMINYLQEQGISYHPLDSTD